MILTGEINVFLMRFVKRPYYYRKSLSRKRSILLTQIICAISMAMPAIILPDAGAGSIWMSSSFDDFNGAGMALGNCRLNLSGEGFYVELNATGDWRQLFPKQSPNSNVNFAMAPIGNENKLVLFGGDEHYDGSYRWLNETWVYDIDNNSWSQMFPEQSPHWLESSAMATIYNDDKVVLFGGFGPGFANETWIYDLGDDQWTRLNPDESPGARYAHSMASIPKTNDILLFGGRGAGFLYDDTWIFNTTTLTWKNAFPHEHPSERAFSALAPIGDDGKVLLFGGENLNDTWVYEYDTNNWIEQHPPTSPINRTGEGLAPILHKDAIILYGGSKPGPVILGDTWIYDLTNDDWEQQSTFHTPIVAGTCGLATIQNDESIIYYGDHETWVFNFSMFSPMGYYCSPFFDTGGSSDFMSIYWTARCPQYTSIVFQIRTANTTSSIRTVGFLGPDGTNNTFYYENNADIWWGHLGDRYIQYKAILRTSAPDHTPSLETVKIFYNRIPGPPGESISSSNGWTNESHPFLAWDFNDTDSISQSGFELQLNSTTDFADPEYSSGLVDSNLSSYRANDSIPDGIWFWRIRTRDIDGDWGPFGAVWKIGIDTVPPLDFKVYVSPPKWTNDPCQITFKTSDRLSGIAGYDVWIDGKDYGLHESPYAIPHMNDGEHMVDVWAVDLAGNRAGAKASVFIDNDRPEPFEPLANPAGWNNGSVEISFLAKDNGSGIEHYAGSIDGGPFSPETTPWILGGLADGEHAVIVRAYDWVGNFRDGSVEIYTDGTPPGGLLLSLSPAGWTNSSPQLAFSAFDPLSKISHFEVKAGAGAFISRTSPCSLDDLPDGLDLVTVRVFDNAGNFFDGNITARIDKTPPNPFSLNITPDGWTCTPPNVQFSTTDNTSGIDYYRMRIDDANYSTASSPEVPSALTDGIHNVTVRAFDKSGNFREATGRIFLDATPPSNVSLKLAFGKRTGSQLHTTLFLSANDNTSGLDRMCFSNDGSTYSGWEPFSQVKNWSIPASGDKLKIYVKVMDKAGNEADPVLADVNVPRSAQNNSMGVAFAVAVAILVCSAVMSLSFVRNRRRKS
jgi:hypothetical protein